MQGDKATQTRSLPPGATPFLLVDDESLWHRTIEPVLSRFGPVLSARSYTEASSHLERVRHGWQGLIVDLVLPDGCGFELLGEARRGGTTAPALVLTGHHDDARIRRAHGVGAEFMCKPPNTDNLESFARRCVAQHWTGNSRLALLVDALAVARALTPREIVLVAANLTGVPRRAVASHLAVSEQTLKSQTRQILIKCQVETLGELSERLLHAALTGASLTRETGARRRPDSGPLHIVRLERDSEWPEIP